MKNNRGERKEKKRESETDSKVGGGRKKGERKRKGTR